MMDCDMNTGNPAFDAEVAANAAASGGGG